MGEVGAVEFVESFVTCESASKEAVFDEIFEIILSGGNAPVQIHRRLSLIERFLLAAIGKQLGLFLTGQKSKDILL